MFPYRRLFVLLLLIPCWTFAQQPEVQGPGLVWNGQEVARWKKTEQDTELPGFELVKRDGSIVLSAYPSHQVRLQEPGTDRTVYACQFQGISEPVYLALGQNAIQEELSQLLTNMGLIHDGGIDAQGVHHLRKKHGIVARETGTPRLVDRDKTSALTLRKSGDIYQSNQLIGRVKSLGPSVGRLDQYQVELPDGQRVATIAFSGGDGALEFTVETAADHFWHPVRRELAAPGKSEPGADPYAAALLRILPWLVQRGYL